ncbi:hypothetical protein [Rickettsia endosymbiont of Aspidapion aeneum]
MFDVISAEHWHCCMARFYPVIARRNVVSTRQSREKIANNAMKFIIF